MVNPENIYVPRGFKQLIEKQMILEGLSLRKLAEKCGISVSFLSRILSGERNLPKNEDIIKIAKALNIKPPERLLIEAGRFEVSHRDTLNISRKFSMYDLERRKKLLEFADRLLKEMEKEGKI